MRIQTGKGTIPLMTLIAIWSISLVVNLPGLAVSPVLGSLDKIFPHTSEQEIQLLTVLPNLLIIPFVLLSGKLSLSSDKIKIVVFALLVYLASGIAYLFANSMMELIVISCFLGMGCGLLIPLAAGLIADTFTGKYRMQQLGIKSGIANIALVLATFVVGWLGKGNWHLPFLVYLIPLVPLVLSVFLKNIHQEGKTIATNDVGTTAEAPRQTTVATNEKVVGGFIVNRLYGLMGVYFFVCYSTVIISYYLPFLMQDDKMSNSSLGTVTALFFLAIFLPGFVLPLIIRTFKQSTAMVATLSMALGLILMATGHNVWIMCVAALLMGFGYGVFQPIIYDKATDTVLSDNKSTLALSFVLAVNYLSITLTPFIIDFFRDLFGIKGNQFPFILNFVLVLIFGVVVYIFRRSFVFRMNEQYYQS